MLLSALYLTALLSWLGGVLGGQVPIIGGILGGVPETPPLTFKQASTSATTPGKLRLVQNSGVCG